MIDETAAHRAAALIGDARTQGRQVGPLPDDCMPGNEVDGYAVQAALHRWFLAMGAGGLSGYKVGATTSVMQEILDIPNPAYGHVMSNRTHVSTTEFAAGALRNPGIECEVAVRLSADTERGRADYDGEGISRHIGACMVAMEIVENRYGDFRTTPAALMIADDFFHSACVLGPDVEDWRDLDLAAAVGRTTIDGTLSGTGVGADVMGHPFEAVAWLANALAARDEVLRAGQFVLCGSLVAVHWVDAFPAEATVEVDGLGSVGASFG
jgi:2-oxo-3-hexenedioate decarboxylase/2-keto-4-pentenoate hydratase